MSTVNKGYFKRSSSDSNHAEEDSDSSLGEDFGCMELIFKETNLILNIGRRKIYIAEEGFRKIYNVFENMVTCDFKEKRTREIDFKGKNYKHFVRFIRVAHPGIHDPFEEETIDQILPLIDEYLAEDARADADKFLVDSKSKKIETMTSEELVAELSKAESYKLETYLNLLVKEASRRRLRKLESQPYFDQITIRTKYAILEKKTRTIEHELSESREPFAEENNYYGFKHMAKTNLRKSASKFGTWFFGWITDL